MNKINITAEAPGIFGIFYNFIKMTIMPSFIKNKKYKKDLLEIFEHSGIVVSELAVESGE